MKIEQIIKKENKEQLYTYYMSLGYDYKTAAALTLFTYGDYRYREFSIDDLYDALCRGEKYLPKEVKTKQSAGCCGSPIAIDSGFI